MNYTLTKAKGVSLSLQPQHQFKSFLTVAADRWKSMTQMIPPPTKVKTLFGYPLPLLPRPQIIAMRPSPSSLCALRCRRSRWSLGARCVRVGLDTENGSVARAAQRQTAVVVPGREGGWAMLNHGGGKGKLQ